MFIVPRGWDIKSHSSVRPSVPLSVYHKNFNLGNNFCTITGRALRLGMCSLWRDLSDGTMSWPWPWPLTYFKVKFVAERGTTILWICLFEFQYQFHNKTYANFRMLHVMPSSFKMNTIITAKKMRKCQSVSYDAIDQLRIFNFRKSFL